MCDSCGCSDLSRPKLINLQSGLTLAIDSANEREPVHSHEHEHSLSAHESRHEHHHHVHDHDHDHDHAHGHDHVHSHGHVHGEAGNGHGHSHTATVRLETDVLAKNNRLAERNRGWFAGRNIFALNLMSAPVPARRRFWNARSPT